MKPETEQESPAEHEKKHEKRARLKSDTPKIGPAKHGRARIWSRQNSVAINCVRLQPGL